MKGFIIFKGAIAMAIVLNLISQQAIAFTDSNNEGRATPKEMLDVADRLSNERIKEEMRDKTHDYRLRVGDDASIGFGNDGVNYKKVFILEKRF